MKSISKLVVVAVTLSSLIACEKGTNVAANNANSAQKAADDYSKTFKQLPTQQTKNNNPEGSPKKPSTDSAGIAGIPKGAVDSAKSVVDKAKEAMGTAGDKISEAKKAVVKAATGKEPVGEAKQKGNGRPAHSIVSAQDAANEASKLADGDTASDIQSVDQKDPKINAATKKNTESAGIAGIPKEAVNSAKSVADGAKEITKEVVDKVSSAGKAVVDDSKSVLGKKPNGPDPK